MFYIQNYKKNPNKTKNKTLEGYELNSSFCLKLVSQNIDTLFQAVEINTITLTTNGEKLLCVLYERLAHITLYSNLKMQFRVNLMIKNNSIKARKGKQETCILASHFFFIESIMQLLFSKSVSHKKISEGILDGGKLQGQIIEQRAEVMREIKGEMTNANFIVA